MRAVYSGPVTSCHTTHMGIIDYEKVLSDKNHWFYDLDFLSLSCYHSAKLTGITKEERKADFLPQLERFRKIAEMYGKPILFGEGCRARKASKQSNRQGYSACRKKQAEVYRRCTR